VCMARLPPHNGASPHEARVGEAVTSSKAVPSLSGHEQSRARGYAWAQLNVHAGQTACNKLQSFGVRV
jgi:hypothetical protein